MAVGMVEGVASRSYGIGGGGNCGCGGFGCGQLNYWWLDGGHSCTDVPSFPLTCRGGGFKSTPHAGDSALLPARPGSAAVGLGAGECTWWDRALRPGEPNAICDDDAAAQGRSSGYAQLLKDSNFYFTVEAYNDNKGCMRVTGVRPTPSLGQAAQGIRLSGRLRYLRRAKCLHRIGHLRRDKRQRE